VEGDQENKTGHQIVSTNQDNTSTWGRSNAKKAHAFAKHLAQVFQPHPTENEPEEE
jgi:hypothetical protein